MIVDNVEFAKDKREFCVTLDVASLLRVKEDLDGISGSIICKITGDKLDKPLLNISIRGKIHTSCQKCLNNLDLDVDYSNQVSIFYNEEELDEALFGADSTYEDGIVADKEFDLLYFIEDELIMLLPISPRHSECNETLVVNSSSNPFNVLSNLIKQEV